MSLYLGNSEVIHRIDSLGIYVLENGKVASLAKYHKDVRCFRDETFTPQTRLPCQKELNKIVELSFFKNYLD